MKNWSVLLALLLLLQSCYVYNQPATVEEAVTENKKVKVITADDKKYKFKRLKNENGRLIGITRVNSVTSQKLGGVPAVIDGKKLELDLSELDIERIVVPDRSASTALTVVAVAAAVAVVYVIVLVIALSDMEVWTGGGSQ